MREGMVKAHVRRDDKIEGISKDMRGWIGHVRKHVMACDAYKRSMREGMRENERVSV